MLHGWREGMAITSPQRRVRAAALSSTLRILLTRDGAVTFSRLLCFPHFACIYSPAPARPHFTTPKMNVYRRSPSPALRNIISVTLKALPAASAVPTSSGRNNIVAAAQSITPSPGVVMLSVQRADSLSGLQRRRAFWRKLNFQFTGLPW